MKILKFMAIILALIVATGIGVYICTDSKPVEQVQEAVLI